MTPGKRLFDILLAVLLIAVLALPFALLLLGLRLTQRGALFYLAERMKTPDQPFLLWKLRTMTVVAQDTGVSGGDKRDRVTLPGRFLRRTRLDEVPQLWNVLRGDMSFVGPRPPLRRYVEQFPQVYAQVLRNRPGMTGLATLVCHRHEERLLASCDSADKTEATYTRRCVPLKAKVDLIYQQRRSLCLDLVLMGRTLGRAIGSVRR